MEEWKRISLSELYSQIEIDETELDGELLNLWELIKITPISGETKNLTIKNTIFGLWQFAAQE